MGWTLHVRELFWNWDGLGPIPDVWERGWFPLTLLNAVWHALDDVHTYREISVS
jgi:hypothetical protein